MVIIIVKLTGSAALKKGVGGFRPLPHCRAADIHDHGQVFRGFACMRVLLRPF